MASNNIVAIVGRPNVGKSTFFNRLVEQRQAIMDNQSGVTRDRHYGHAEWCDYFFTVIDTGGYVVGSEDVFESNIRQQVGEALEEATVIIFMVDAMTGLTDLDKDFANVLRRTKKPVYIVANKAETPERDMGSVEFYELGMGEIYPISSMTGSGTGDLLDQVITNFEAAKMLNAQIEVFGINGSLLDKRTTNETETTLQAPGFEAIYIVRITLANGKTYTKNLLVKN